MDAYKCTVCKQTMAEDECSYVYGVGYVCDNCVSKVKPAWPRVFDNISNAGMLVLFVACSIVLF